MVLVFYALRRELGGVRKRIGNRCALDQGLRGFRGRLGGEDIFLVATGIGTAPARDAARRALQTLLRPRLVISTGVAGGLSPDLRAGDLVIADRLLLESGDDSRSASLRAGSFSFGIFNEVARTAPDTVESVRIALRRAGLAAAVGPMLTARRVLSSAAAKHEAYARSGAIAVDMESAVIAAEVAVAGFPFVCLRAVIDEAHHEIPGADLADESGHVAPLSAAAFFLKNPSSLARVPAILKNLRRATTAIGSALEALCSAAST
jgi:nucleoside phosphorylase